MWEDKANVTLMKKVQVLQNLAAKIVLDMPKHSSDLLLRRSISLAGIRRFCRLILFFKALNGLLYWNFKFHSYKDTHNYNTQRRNNIFKPQSHCSWGQNHLIYQAADDWSIFSDEVKNIFDILFVTWAPC